MMEVCLSDSEKEKCLLGNEIVELPQALLEYDNVFKEVLSKKTWDTVLTAEQRRHLEKFLPDFPENNESERNTTVKMLLNWENVKFGNPVQAMHANLRGGMYSPDIAKYSVLCKKAKLREYHYQQQRYYTKLLKEILVCRQSIFSQLGQTTPNDEPLRFRRPPPQLQELGLEKRVRKKYLRILHELREECGEPDTSSDEEHLIQDLISSAGEKRKLYSEPSVEATPPSVVSTLMPQSAINGDLSDSGPASPFEVTDDDYMNMLIKHKKRKIDMEEHPELDTTGITLQDIIERVHNVKKLPPKTPPTTEPATAADKGGTANVSTAKKRVRTKDAFRRKKIKEKLASTSSHNDEEDSLAATALEGVKQEADEYDSEATNESSASLRVKPLVYGQHACFFSLLKDLICEAPEGRVSTAKLEEKVRQWQDTAFSATNTWFSTDINWMELVSPALKFFSGDILGLTLDNFVPLVDYKERAQLWKWIGQGRDDDAALIPLCRHWMQLKGAASSDLTDNREGSPPPPRVRTSFVVRHTTEDERRIFRVQEKQRFENPHKAFTYRMHGYEAVVGPVKGVYTKDGAMNKAREHALLIGDRPAYVTILTLVRDAAARLPNGEGTRSDICELLKDSLFIAPGVTDSQINTVVSGALDRLHYEKDPCVKYDVNRKLWIYLHRNRIETEFERIHQAQGAAVKAKKALTQKQPRPPKMKKDADCILDTALLSQQISKSSPVTSLTKLTPTRSVSSVLNMAASSASAAVKTLPPATTSSGKILSAPTTPRVSALIGAPALGRSLSVTSSSRVTTSRASASPKVSVAGLLQQAQAISKEGLMPTSVQVGKPATAAAALQQATMLGQRLMFNQSGGKPMAFTFVQPNSPRHLTAGSKPVAFSIIQQQQQQQQPQQSESVVISSAGSKSATVLSSTNESQAGRAVSPKVTSIPATNPKPGTPPISKPVMARLVQQQPQMVTMGNLLANTVNATHKHGQQLQTIKIGGKPVTMATSATSQHSMISGKPVSMAISGKPVTMAAGGKPVSLIGGKPMSIVGGKPVSMATTGKPLSVVGGKPVSMTTTGKPLSMAGGKPLSMSIGGKPVIVAGGKAVAMATGGKPMSVGTNKTLTLSAGGKPTSGGIHGASTGKISVVTKGGTTIPASTSSASGVISQILQAGRTATPPGSPGAKIVGQGGQGGLVVHQVGQSGLALKQAAAAAASTGVKLVSSQGGAIPAHLLVQQAAAQAQAAKLVRPQQITSGGKPAQNIQLVKTVLTQPGGKPAQTTFLITQAGGQTTAVRQVPTPPLPSKGKSPPASGAAKSKTGPVYARIITPPPGIGQTVRLAAPAAGVNVIQQPNSSVAMTMASETQAAISSIMLDQLPGDT
ncbi:uncharacterized protein LOC141906799 [Tubulanus polymorphus]|uniref:uncharacterized protein LOC141906799 n=1 Tax=Tubulanus polymorphus TaxID=672921 RepID=UPI003DA3807E